MTYPVTQDVFTKNVRRNRHRWIWGRPVRSRVHSAQTIITQAREIRLTRGSEPYRCVHSCLQAAVGERDFPRVFARAGHRPTPLDAFHRARSSAPVNDGRQASGRSRLAVRYVMNFVHVVDSVRRKGEKSCLARLNPFEACACQRALLGTFEKRKFLFDHAKVCAASL